MSAAKLHEFAPYYQDEAVTIYHGDCLDILPQLGAVDLVATDPPYNLGKEYGDSSDDQRAAYEDWSRRWFWAADRVAKDMVVFPGLANLFMWGRIVRTPTAVGCWHLPGSPGSGYPFNFLEWEPWIYWGRTFVGGSNVIRATISAQRGVGDHPCPKPLSLFRSLIPRFKPQLVLDPFAGSGTTLRAAKDCGVRSVGIEIEESYCEIAATRCAQEVLDLAI